MPRAARPEVGPIATSKMAAGLTEAQTRAKIASALINYGKSKCNMTFLQEDVFDALDRHGMDLNAAAKALVIQYTQRAATAAAAGASSAAARARCPHAARMWRLHSTVLV